MTETDLAFKTASEIAPLLRSGRVTSRELTELMLERIDAYDGALNAFVTVTADLALSQADKADKELATGQDRGPLHGIPFALKDLIATEAVRTTAGSKYYENWVPDKDATVVTLLSDAGAVCLGKTGLNELALGATSINPHFGAIANPWKPDHHPGGSSGGSAVAVAAGLAYFALGTDTGCSIRQPAQCCGIVGHKPTFGLVSKSGVIPLVPSLDHVGPMTRSVRDAAAVLQTIVQPDPTDPSSSGRKLDVSMEGWDSSLDGIRLGVPRGYFFDGGDGEVVGIVQSAIGDFEETGAKLIDIGISDVEEAFGAVIATFGETVAIHGDAVRSNPELFSRSVRGMLESDSEITAAQYDAAQLFRRRFLGQLEMLLSEVDAFVMPTSTVAAAPIAEQPKHHAKQRWKNACIFNFTGQPAISVPCGFTKCGLPVGLMIAGRAFDDATILRIAHAHERATPWRDRHPVLKGTRK